VAQHASSPAQAQHKGAAYPSILKDAGKFSSMASVSAKLVGQQAEPPDSASSTMGFALSTGCHSRNAYLHQLHPL
jgi:hypothetical protein